MANHFFLCLAHEKSIDHILLHCGKARMLWELLFSLFRVCWVMQPTLKDTLLGGHGSFFLEESRKKFGTLKSLLDSLEREK